MYYNVKFVVRETGGNVRTFRFDVISEDRLNRFLCYGCWEGGDVRSVNVYANGEWLCRWTPEHAAVAA